ncbi:pyridoxal phosphate-dependent decarboxylase family protein [Kaistia granuli]|uniref:pyridoxal phosphate-dependent decarboxylase family protein n=1 Tax=Kaistia granuli TaxID=363259 RepID=UPI000382382D|nr:pyridoxal-dependent decarboxylase [Kaistia granuli]
MDDSDRDLFARAAAHALAFRKRLASRLQRPEHGYAEALADFAGPLPEAGADGRAILDDLVDRATPGLHAMAGTRFFGWVIGSSHPVGVAADWMTAAWGQNAGNHAAAPAAAACESVAAQWLLELLDLPSTASVGFVTGATVANFVALAAARGAVLRRLGWDVEADGLFGAPSVRVIIGEEAHSTVFSALQYLGLGQARVTKVAVDQEGAMLPEAFAAAMAAAADEGAVIAITQAGQINSGAFDPHPAILASARRHSNCWVHVDGAFGLWARACPDRAFLANGIEGADSWATDGHKWLQTPYDCGFAIVRDAEAHRRAMTIAASYLPAVAEGERDPSHYVPELSRRARGFATFAMIRHFGRAGVAEMVGRHCRLARQLADTLRAEPGIAVMNDVVLNQLIVRFGSDRPREESDALTRSTIATLQREGRIFAGGAQWRGDWILRISVIGGGTTDDDIAVAAQAILEAWRGAQG